MYKRIGILSPDGLSCELWEFLLMLDSIHFTLYFNAYFYQVRKTKRHKWVTKKQWGRLDSRSNNILRPETPISIVIEVKQFFASSIQGLSLSQ